MKVYAVCPLCGDPYVGYLSPIGVYDDYDKGEKVKNEQEYDECEIFTFDLNDEEITE